MMNKPFFLRLLAALLPVALFAFLYPIYLSLFYRYTPETPHTFQNWGYVLGTVIFVTRVVNFGSSTAQDPCMALLTWSRIGYNLLVVVVAWLLLGNIRALFEFIRPFRQNLILHILLLFALCLVGARELMRTVQSKQAGGRPGGVT
jgi:hypothetical protein